MLGRITKYSVKNILRNKFLSISSILVLTLLMFFVNILVVVEDISDEIISTINSKLTISLYLEDKYSKTTLDVSDFLDEIKEIDEEIWVEYKTKEMVLNEIRLKEPSLVQILERKNPLPDTIVVSNISLSDYDNVNSKIESRLYLFSNDEAEQQSFADYSQQYKKITDVTSNLFLLQMWLYAVILIFLISISIIMYSIIWNFIYYYRDEIYITKLVWWSNSFIYGPFVLQWIIYSIISYFLNLIVFVLILKYLSTLVWEIYIYEIPDNILLMEFLLFIIIWWVSWFFSSKKYLKR